MALAPGSRIGSYEVVAQIGAGGMGEVYRARDTRLKRDVALKILPDSFANDPERLARFQREAEVLASLNHPNIAAIHGLEESDPSAGSGQASVRALVMELVEGETLADRIARGPVPVNEALAIAKQIAEALDAAHEQGIIHRDLKPANIKLRDDGTVKVLDFGLAKLGPGGADSLSAPGATHSPTLSLAFTGVGMILGTAAYMSPEQARGKTVDKRADIWAFGCVLFEMLTGKRAFDGTDATEMIAAVVRAEPEWSALPPATPPKLIAVLKRCLQKDPRLRARDIGDLRFELDEVSRAPGPADTSTAIPLVPLWRRAIPYAAVVLVTVGLTAWAASLLRPAASDRPVARFVINLPENERFSNTGRHAVAISPDDSHIVYGANGRLNLRRLDQLVATPIRGTEGALTSLVESARNPFFSPDGQWIGFWQNGQLKKVSVTGGAAIVLCAADNPWGASWSADDFIVFGQGPKGIMRVAGAGGTPELVVKVDSGESAHGPQMLPAGRGILFTLRPSGAQTWDESRIVVQSLTTGERKEVIKGGSDARYLPTGHLVYALEGTVLAVPFDVDTLSVTGGPVPVLEQVARAGVIATGAAHFSVSARGTLVYIEDVGAVAAAKRTLTWVDRNGRETAIKAPARAYQFPRLSADGQRIAVDTTDEQRDVWIWNLAGETLTRLTLDSATDGYALWTPDGRRVIFNSTRAGSRGIRTGSLYWQASDGTGAAERLTDTPNNHIPNAVSPDGTKLVVREETINGSDLLLLPLQGERRTQPLVQTPFMERNADISPDGRWLAYESNESGQFEVYVRPFPNVNDGRWQVSTGGGSVPLWARNGREMFFMTLRGESLMAASILESPGSAAFRSGAPIKLFDTRGYFAPTLGPNNARSGRMYDVSADGRFLMIKDVSVREGTPAPQSIMVIQNWVEELKRRVTRN
jgi:eukaryotic-like serine/threonine-protein kinase